ncbi:MAG: YhcH/YjgK/YiaL family protein [Candidatus Nephrothrix sp. EaCA]|nr:MAG: YhcH/YjgK/YiaL family protein [Candidatus Nephrothrix sp. EaCA]
MIIDSIENAAQYASLHPLFAASFDYIQTANLKKEAEGKREIAKGLLSIISRGPGKTKEASLEKFECHNKNIDIQYAIEGTETFAWRPRQSCTQPKGEFDHDKDVLFFHDAPDFYFQLKAGQFVILFPHDVHAPMIGDGEIKKLVLKVLI